MLSMSEPLLNFARRGCHVACRLEDRYSLSSSEVGFSFLAIAGPNVVFAPLAVRAPHVPCSNCTADAFSLSQGWLTDRLGARPLMLACIASFALWNGLMCIDALPYPAFLVILFGVGASARYAHII